MMTRTQPIAWRMGEQTGRFIADVELSPRVVPDCNARLNRESGATCRRDDSSPQLLAWPGSARPQVDIHGRII